MSQACSGGLGRTVGREAIALRAAEWLALAASPIFAAMALLTAMLEGSAADLICSGPDPWPLSGMVTMYLLMSAFHATAWLRRIGRGARRGAA